MRRLRGSKRTTTNEKLDVSDDRIPQRQLGNCSRGKCTGELACKDEGKHHYICLCPQDSKAPMADGSCPRHTVPLKPGLIPNVLPPSNVPHASPGAHTISNQTVIDTTPAVNYVSEHPSHVNSNYNYYLIGGGLSITLASIIILGLIVRRKCFMRNEHNSMASPINLKSSLLLPKRYAPNPQYTSCAGTGVPLLRKETLKFLHEIGEGCFGKVFKGEYSIDVNDKMEIVAIKVLKENATKEAEEDFLREVEIMSAFRHPNILTLLGVVPRDGYINPMMVFEYMSHGDLAELLRCQKKSASYEPDVPQLTSMDHLHVALQISRGMSYLAAQRFVHRDLACRNCLVAQGPVVKIADFGMSRDVYTCDYYKIGGSRLLPVRWMSPESVVYGRFTLESDIWSYGVILWEIFSLGKQPYYGHTNEEVVKLILDGIMLIPPIDCPSIICELMKNCWKTEPRDRIRFASICDKLEAEYENMTPSSHNFHNETVNTFHQKHKGLEGDFKGKLSTLGKSLPRPPPIAQLMQEDILDPQGYLLANEIKDPVQYLETLSG